MGLDADVNSSGGYLTIQPDREYRRLAATVDLKLATKILNGDGGCDAGDQFRFDDIHSKLHKLNSVTETAIRHHLKAAVSNTIHSVWERFINPNGERASAVSYSHTLMNRYFFPIHLYYANKTRICSSSSCFFNTTLTITHRVCSRSYPKI